jgi:hypothetical protein
MRDAEHLRDHGKRRRPGEVDDQVHAACGGCLVDERGGPFGDGGPVALDPAGGKQTAEGVPKAPVPVAVIPAAAP